MAAMSTETKKVILAMSGGVDSSVAAKLLLEADHEVTGVFLCMGTAGASDGDSRGCCSPQDAADARRVAQKLGIDLHVLEVAELFGGIVDNFAAEYARGQTPNPCIHCNTRIKFGRLMDLADSLGIRYVATGHHARVADVAGRTAICRARDRRKDQSYALFGIAAERLARILLPIGEVDDKDTVRSIARSLGLNVHNKPDSQEICFAPDNDYAQILRQRAPEALTPGAIIDSSGQVLGQHDGYGQFTIGQRRGLRVAAGKPMYVTRIDPESAAVTIGPRAEVQTQRLQASSTNWHCDVPDEFDATVQIRYNHLGTPACVRICDKGSMEVLFFEPVTAVTPGQAAVVYDGDRLLGGGWIDGPGL